MTPGTNNGAAPANRLLAALPKNEYQRLLPQLKTVSLVFAKVLYEPGDTIRRVYFPNDSIISLLSAVETKSTIEVGIVGNEGMAGLSVFMGVNKSRTLALVQGEGTAMTMKASTLHQEANRLGSLHRLLHRYSHALMTQISQSSACNRFHNVDARLARWLLMSSDRMGSGEFRLTQDFMSNMLGVRREGVNKAAGDLQKEKLISYSRGSLKILDRPGLEAVSCHCYGIIKAECDSYLN
jgi:CRP-like cAMP-binding protein